MTTRDVFDVMARKVCTSTTRTRPASCSTCSLRHQVRVSRHDAIGDSPEEAWDTYQSATEALLEEAEMACTPGTLPA